MKPSLEQRRRHVLGRISSETKGPPGIHMEVSGQWNQQGLTG